MSTRYLKKDNVVLVGIAKNGSQAIKQIGLNNDGFEIREQQGEWNEDNFIDWYDENLLILIPMRKPKEIIEKPIKPKSNIRSASSRTSASMFFRENTPCLK